MQLKSEVLLAVLFAATVSAQLVGEELERFFCSTCPVNCGCRY
jgi:hypothetical protein